MTKDEAVTALYIEKEILRERLAGCLMDFQDIASRLVCIGGPFNDNRECFNEEQLKYLRPILGIAESYQDSDED